MSSESVSTSTTSSEVYKSKKVMKAVSNILSEIVNENKINKISKEIVEKQKKLSFYSKNPASVSLTQYIDRILKYTHIEESTLIIALIFIDRICEINDLVLTDSNIHRVIFTAVIVAVKYNEDDYYSNSYYSKVGGIATKELNTLEYEFIKLIKYSLFVKNDLFEKYRIYLHHYQVKK
jgi:hypothetical protein